MEIKNIHEHAGWYASYVEDNQGKALIVCQKKKIEQLEKLIDLVKGELELAENPKEFKEQIILASIKAMIEEIPLVEHREGYFKWIG